MKLSEEIIKSGILGTDKYAVSDFGDLADFSRKISGSQTDKEDGFLKNAFTAFLYEEHGFSGVALEASFPECTSDILPVANEDICQQLSIALQTKNDIVFRYLVFLFNKNQQLVNSILVPSVLNKALEQKKQAGALLAICGETGKWLCSLNPEWKVLTEHTVDEKDIWETGAVSARKDFLFKLRKDNPSEALALLQQSIQEETADVRVEFIQVLEENLSLDDEAFLNLCLKDKSQKVKQLAYSLLKILEDSELNTAFFNYVSNCLSIKEERHLLISKKKVLSLTFGSTPDETIFKSGVEKISSQKGVDDNLFWFAQVLAYTNPSKLAQKLNCTEQELFKYFSELKEIKILLPYLIESTLNYKNETWAHLLLSNPDMTDIRILEIIKPTGRAAYYDQFIEKNLGAVIDLLCDSAYTELSYDIAAKILKSLEQQPYQINQYAFLALYLPQGINKLLEDYLLAVREDYQFRYFQKQVHEIQTILDIKKNIKF